MLGLALSAPLPDDEAAPAAVPYVLPYTAGVYPYAGLPYAGVPLVYAAPAPLGKRSERGKDQRNIEDLSLKLVSPSDSGLVYPLAEPYVHDATGDVSDDSYPAAEAYVHDTTGDA